METWFSIEAKDNNITVHLKQNEQNKWLPEYLLNNPINLSNAKKHPVIIEGKAPVWMYAYVAIQAYKAGASEILIYQPNVNAPIKIFPIDDYRDSNNLFFQSDDILQNIEIVRFIPKLPSDPWDPKGLIHVKKHFHEHKPKHCCLTGQGANWMYASFAVQACKAGMDTISCYIPRESSDKIIILKSESHKNNFIEYSDIVNYLKVENGLVIGIVGDPNSGKSVFSAALAAVSYDLTISNWILDCDGASPTPKWFTSMMRKGNTDEAIQLRSSQKIQWTHELEKNIANQIRNLKNTTKLTIADLPGGDHRDKNNIMRIPPGREVMMKEIDKFIILGRKNEKIAEKWGDELKKHNLDNRIIAILNSHSPEAQPICECELKSGIFVGSVSGLDRKQSLEIYTKNFKTPLSKLFQTILSEN